MNARRAGSGRLGMGNVVVCVELMCCPFGIFAYIGVEQGVHGVLVIGADRKCPEQPESRIVVAGWFVCDIMLHEWGYWCVFMLELYQSPASHSLCIIVPGWGG